uniref:uncharacterized protein LOC122598131 isoform X2 n=1 Tax=Erigeron canadensis TaxID=72917 RepID=UPI001CB98ABD|nr:uncharacterized protein LOC122598131 isoform X2 [Erigeron canadensis]
MMDSPDFIQIILMRNLMDVFTLMRYLMDIYTLMKTLKALLTLINPLTMTMKMTTTMMMAVMMMISLTFDEYNEMLVMIVCYESCCCFQELLVCIAPETQTVHAKINTAQLHRSTHALLDPSVIRSSPTYLQLISQGYP